MLKKSLILPVFLAASLQVIYKSEFMIAMSKNILAKHEYDVFTGEFRSFALFFSLVVFLGMLFLFQPQTLRQQTSTNKYWNVGFLAILFLSSATVLYVNPDGRFPWNRRNLYIASAVRTQKIDLYKEIDHTPDLVLFGSSVSFSIPIEYLEEKWNLEAFNMSVEGGGPGDFVNLVNIIKRISPDSKMPSVIMVEILRPSLSLEFFEQRAPLEFIPYMNTVDQQKKTAWDLIENSFHFKALSDSIFTLFIVDGERWRISNVMNNKGTSLRKDDKLMTDENYKKVVKNKVRQLHQFKFCQSLDPDGKLALDALVQMSREYKFGLLIYRTPINEDFYTFSKFKPSIFTKCSKLFNEYIRNITSENSNVFYKDLSQYEKIAAGGKEMYLDTHHLTKQANIMLLDALHNEIEAAIQWAKENR